MKKIGTAFAALLLLVGCFSTAALAQSPKDFGAQVQLTRSEESWNTESDGSGADWDTVLMEYQLKGTGIKSYQGIWVAIDTAVLIPVPYERDGFSFQGKIADGTIRPDYSSRRLDDSRYYRLREPVDNGIMVTDKWSFGTFNDTLVALSADKQTLYLCPQPSQAETVTYDAYTTVVSFRLAILPGAALAKDSIRLVRADERDLLHQSFIAAMCDGRAGYYYGDSGKDDTLAEPSVVIEAGLLSEEPTPSAPSTDTPGAGVLPEEPTPSAPSTDAPGAGVLPEDPIPSHPFTDVPKGAPYEEAVDFVYWWGLFDGVSKTEFAPEKTMTRAMFVTVLGRLAKVDVTGYTDTHFSDVVGGTWYAPYVAWATEQGIVEGYGNGLFGVDDPVTVEQAIVLMARYGTFTGLDTTHTAHPFLFADEEEVSSWAKSAMTWGVSSGIYRGENGYLLPTSPAKRSLVAQIFFEYVSRFVVVS